MSPGRADTDRAAPGMPDHFTVAEIVEVDLSGPLPRLARAAHGRTLVFVRLCHEPVGMLFVDTEAGLDPPALARAISSQLPDRLREMFGRHGIPVVPLTADGMPHHDCGYLARLSRAAADGPPISVIIPTLNGADRLRRCVEHLFRSRYGIFEVLVVDNGSTDHQPEALISELQARFGTGDRLRGVTAPGGVAAARNAGWRTARYALCAFIDDDERPDPWWLAAIGQEFGADEVGFVTGPILPAELETEAQATFETFGGHSKGRGFARTVFDADYQRSVQPAMFPVPPFGAGGNMSFRRAALERIGGFDDALRFSEDTLVLSEVLLSGWTGVYAPDMIVWHPHHRDDDGRARQLGNYAVGLGMFYTALLIRRPRRLLPLLMLAPRALRYLREPVTPGGGPKGERVLARPSMDVRGLLRGPQRYLRARLALLWSGRGGRLAAGRTLPR